jgi:hypothetical protein
MMAGKIRQIPQAATFLGCAAPRFQRLALFNPLGKNQPSSSRRFELFAIPAVTYGFPDFAFDGLAVEWRIA